MKKYILILILILNFSAKSQWKEIYATYDDETNGTGDNTTDVTVFAENKFVALCTQRNTTCFLIPYVNADSALGRKQFYGYSPTTDGFFQKWSSGFDEVELNNAWHAVKGNDNFLYVANNDTLHNILVFQLNADTIESVDYRLETGSNGLSGIAIDSLGFVYVLNDTTENKIDDIKIFSPKNTWPSNRTMQPIKTIDLPNGVYKNIVVTPKGDQIFVSNYKERKVERYLGSAQTNYILDTKFNYKVSPTDTNLVGAVYDTAYIVSLGYLKGNNLLYVGLNKLFGGSSWYKYSKIYTVNPNTSEVIDTLDQAKWNFNLTSGYNKRGNGTVPGNASGYASPYDIDFDENKNLYTVSFYGWTVEKWKYEGVLPTITKIEKINNLIPNDFKVEQNFPNPFNPKTTIRFSIANKSNVKITISNMLGQIILVPFEDVIDSGVYSVNLDLGSLPSGNYYYTVSNNNKNITKSMQLLK